MVSLDVRYINTKLLEKGDYPFKLADLEYPEVRTDGHHLLDNDGNPVGTKGDMYAKVMMDRLLREAVMILILALNMKQMGSLRIRCL